VARAIALLLTCTALACASPRLPARAPSVAADETPHQATPAPPPLAPSPLAPPCPADTYWDGFACIAPRATCGGWDGVSCTPEPIGADASRRATLEYAQIVAEARAICQEEDATAPPAAPVLARDLIINLDAALGKANALDRRLARVRENAPIPSWRVTTLARAGSIYDCLRSNFLRATPSIFSPRQLALLAKLQGIQSQLGPPSTQQINATTDAVREKWRKTRDQYASVLTTKMFDRYVTAEVLAHRYALDGFASTRAAVRLPALAAEMGEPAFRAAVESVVDPTDPRTDAGPPRHLQYVPGVFDRDR
jgi:hypothetical protein